uniref:Uncharacterized protein n=1 Tax=Elaeophora elaphi TaxID=1147741 RepID=A0A0R3RZN6_9BILA
MSVPHLFRLSTVGVSSIGAAPSNEITTLRERNSILARNNAHLKEELISLKHLIESSKRSTPRVFSNNDTTSSNKSSSANIINEHSPAFDLAADLMQVQEDLENVIIQIDNSATTNKDENNGDMNKSASLSVPKRSISSSNITELEQLKTALKKSEEEHEALAEQLDRVTLNFHDACRELNLYKYELRDDALKYSHDTRLPRSRSVIEVGRATVDLDEYLRWKEKAGTMFRELNRIRKEYRACDCERRELRMQLVMLRGELGLAQCQLAEILSNQRRKQSMSNVSAASASGISSSTSTKRKKMKSKLLQGSHPDEFWDTMDSSSAVFLSACTSMSSLNEIMFSTSEPELVAAEFEGVREYRLCNYGYRDFCLLPSYYRESHRPPAYLEKIQRNQVGHEEMIRETLHGTRSEWQLYEEQSLKNRQKLKNLEKQIAELEKEQARLTKGVWFFFFALITILFFFALITILSFFVFD